MSVELNFLIALLLVLKLGFMFSLGFMVYLGIEFLQELARKWVKTLKIYKFRIFKLIILMILKYTIDFISYF